MQPIIRSFMLYSMWCPFVFFVGKYRCLNRHTIAVHEGVTADMVQNRS